MMFATVAVAMMAAPASEWPEDFDAPSVAYPAIVDHAPNIAGFVPQGWKPAQSVTGDLNRDRVPDIAIVIQKDDPANRLKLWEGSEHRYDTNPRVLVIGFGQPDGGYARAATDYLLVSRLTNSNMEEPFDEIEIVKDVLRLKMHVFMNAGGWWMGNYKFSFRWQDGGMKLIGYDRNGIKRNTHEMDGLSINYLTRVRIDSGTDEDEANPWRKRSRFKLNKMIDMNDVGDALMFDPGE